MKKHTLHRRARRSLLRDSEGVTAVEFALISPVMLLMMFGVIEFSLVMYVMNVMEGATAFASRYGKTGYVSLDGTTREQQIKANVASRTAGLLDAAKITVQHNVYPSFNSISTEPYTDANSNKKYDSGETYVDSNGNGQWDQEMGPAGLGNANDIVVYTVSYPWHVNTPIIANFLGDTFTIRARSVVKNEPY